MIDSCAVSVGAGLLLEAAGEAIAAGAGLDEVAALVEKTKREIRIFGTVASLDFAVRGGRLSPSMARTLTRLHLAPIIVFDETGKAGKGGAALGFDRALNAIVKRAVRFAAGAPARAMVVHSGDQAGADFVAARLAERLGGEVPVRARRRRAHHARRRAAPWRWPYAGCRSDGRARRSARRLARVRRRFALPLPAARRFRRVPRGNGIVEPLPGPFLTLEERWPFA